MNILITGGAGFIGSHIAEHLVSRGDTVTIVDNLATGLAGNITKSDSLTFIQGDISDNALVERTFDNANPEVVIHAAASYKDPNNWERDTKTNVLGGATIVKACKRTGIRRLIYFQTALCYGLHPALQPIPVDHPLDAANSSYAITKTAAEQFIRISGIDYISFRLANIIGPRNLSGPIPTFYKRLSANKPCFVSDTHRDFVFVKDLVKVVVRAIDGGGETGIYHISSGGDFAIQEVYDAVLKVMNIRPENEVKVRPRNPDDAFTILLDPSKTERDFGWKTATPLETTIQAAVDWYEQYGVDHTFTHLTSGKEEKPK